MLRGDYQGTEELIVKSSEQGVFSKYMSSQQPRSVWTPLILPEDSLEAPTPPRETRETLGLTGVLGPPRTVVAPLAPLGLMAVVGPPLGLVPLEPQAAGPRAPRRPPLRQPRWNPDQALKKTISRDPLRLTSITLTFLYATPILPPGSSFRQRY